MPIPITSGTGRILMLPAPRLGPTSEIVNTSAEMVFNDVGEGLTGP